MNQVNFFTEVAGLMDDKESIEIKVQKTGEELTVLVIPKIKNKTATITMSGTPEDLNEGFIGELNKPIEKIKGLISNASEAEVTDAEDEEEEDDDDKKEAAAPKKSSAKKAAPKKPAKSSAKKEEVKKEEITETGNSTSEDDELPAKEENVTAVATDLEDEAEKARVQADWEARFTAEEAEAERKEAERLETERIIAEQKERDQKNKEEFDAFVVEGDTAFDARKYEDAETAYKKATDIFPEDATVKSKFEKAQKWVNQLISAGILPARKEEEDGANS